MNHAGAAIARSVFAENAIEQRADGASRASIERPTRHAAHKKPNPNKTDIPGMSSMKLPDRGHAQM